MKTGKGVFIFVLLTGLILGGTQSALLYGAETPEGNPWDQFVYTKHFKGTTLEGPLSIYYEYQPGVFCDDGSAMAIMFYTVRLNKYLQTTLYVSQGRTLDPICVGDIQVQGTEIINFLESVVLPEIFPNGFKEWHLTAIEKAQFHDQMEIEPFSRAFVADIEIVVKEGHKGRKEEHKGRGWRHFGR